MFPTPRAVADPDVHNLQAMARRGSLARRSATIAVAGALVLAACADDDDDSDPDGTAADTAGSAGSADATDTDTDTAASDEEADPGDSGDPDGSEPDGEPDVRPASYVYPDPPAAPAADDPSPTAADEAIDAILLSVGDGGFDFLNANELGAVGDARHAWFVTDLMRFFGGDEGQQLRSTFERLTGVRVCDQGFGRSANSITVNFVVGPVDARCTCISSTTPSKRP